MKLKELMKKNVECVKPNDTVADAAQKMRSRGVGFLPVCDDSNQIIGTLTDRDLALRVLADSLPATTIVSRAMTPEAITCREDDDIDDVEKLMAKHQKSRIMVVDKDGKLCGVVSLSDIAQHEGKRKAGKVLADVSEREART